MLIIDPKDTRTKLKNLGFFQTLLLINKGRKKTEAIKSLKNRTVTGEITVTTARATTAIYAQINIVPKRARVALFEVLIYFNIFSIAIFNQGVKA